MNASSKNNLSCIGEGIYQSNLGIVKISPEDIEFIKQIANVVARRRARICAHQSNDQPLHEMMIAICSDSYIHPHRHLGKSESFHIVEGQVDVIVLDDEGGIREVVQLGDPLSGKNFYYRLSNAYYHTLIIHSDVLVVHEVTNGPFVAEETQLAPFAPDETNAEASKNYMQQLKKQVYG